FKDEKYVYTDYMSLYKFKDGWKIVNKTYHSNHKHKKEKKKKA
ncbi:MAG: nuclear transport factor 2 family protein, partial [bacterium]|nr:nuclear transport factor 2 family protein [bacterium]